MPAAWGSKKDTGNKESGEAFWVLGAIRGARASQGSFAPHSPARGGAATIPTVQVGTRRWTDEGHVPSEGRGAEMNGSGRLTSEPVHPEATATTSVTRAPSKGEGMAEGSVVGPERKGGDRGSGPFGLGTWAEKALLLGAGALPTQERRELCDAEQPDATERSHPEAVRALRLLPPERAAEGRPRCPHWTAAGESGAARPFLPSQADGLGSDGSQQTQE